MAEPRVSRFTRRKKFCRFTAEGVKEIDYKDLNTLRQYVTENGKIVPSEQGVSLQPGNIPDTAPPGANGDDPGIWNTGLRLGGSAQAERDFFDQMNQKNPK